VKKHREATQLDFRQSKEEITQNFDNKISFTNKQNQKNTEILKKQKLLTPEQLEERLNMKIKESENQEKIYNELLKQKQLLLYKELKAKRVKKIKSKIYRRIKKRKQNKLEEANINSRLQTDKAFAFEELEKLEKKRAEERASLRHRNKTKYTLMLNKYADQKASQYFNKECVFRFKPTKKGDRGKVKRFRKSC
jgi:U3 small nucleolar RNA-associated protein 14